MKVNVSYLGLVKTEDYNCRWASLLFVGNVERPHIYRGRVRYLRESQTSNQRNLVSPMRSRGLRALANTADLTSAAVVPINLEGAEQSAPTRSG
jgi:hypothetical protein